MKPLEEIEKLLIIELENNLDEIKSDNNLGYYNEHLGNSSFILAGMLVMFLKDLLIHQNLI